MARTSTPFAGPRRLGLGLGDGRLPYLVATAPQVEAKSAELLLDLEDLIVGSDLLKPLVESSQDRVPTGSALDPASPAVGNPLQERTQGVLVISSVARNAKDVGHPLQVDGYLAHCLHRSDQLLLTSSLESRAAVAEGGPQASSRSSSGLGKLLISCLAQSSTESSTGLRK